jgi:hypothetical protein
MIKEVKEIKRVIGKYVPKEEYDKIEPFLDEMKDIPDILIEKDKGFYIKDKDVDHDKYVECPTYYPFYMVPISIFESTTKDVEILWCLPDEGWGFNKLIVKDYYMKYVFKTLAGMHIVKNKDKNEKFQELYKKYKFTG